MSKSEISASSSQLKINPQQVKWKYFYPNRDGSIGCCTDPNTIPKIDGSDLERNKVAVLTTSLFFGEKDKNKTPNRMRDLVKTALFYEGRPLQLCALPYDDARGAHYYGALPKISG